MKALSLVFGFLYASAEVLAGSAGALVTASLFIADRSPQSARFLWVSLFITGLFLAIGLRLAGIAWQILGVTRIARQPQGSAERALAVRVRRLLVQMIAAGVIAAGVVVCAVLALAVYAILARVDAGFAVFG